jgi:hypothetical protein
LTGYRGNIVEPLTPDPHEETEKQLVVAVQTLLVPVEAYPDLQDCLLMQPPFDVDSA